MFYYKRNTFLYMVIVATIMIGLCSCIPNNQQECRIVLQDVMTDFVFAGYTSSSNNLYTQFFPDKRSELPAKIIKGTKYCFFHKISVDNFELFEHVFTKRLKNKGFSVTKPAADDVGFILTFSSENCHGDISAIYNTKIFNDPSTKDIWAPWTYTIEFY